MWLETCEVKSGSISSRASRRRGDAYEQALLDQNAPARRMAAREPLTFIGMGITGLAGSAWAQLALLAIVAVCILRLLVHSYLVWRSDLEKTSEARTQPAER